MSTPSRATTCPRARNGRTFCSACRSCNYPERMNCVSELLDRWVASGGGDRPCLISPAESLTYAQLAERVNRIANVLTRELGFVPGNRVLLRGPNSPMMVAAYLAVIKAGGVVVATMPLLRAKEIAYPITKAKIRLALCDYRLADEMEKARALAPRSRARRLLGQRRARCARGADGAGPATRLSRPATPPRDDVCLIGFTSGTTGEPKGTMHFHRDMLATCDSYGRHVLRAEPSDRFIGSPPLAFTFGLGGLVLFPLRIGASTVLLEKAGAGRPARRPSAGIAPPSASPRRPPIARCSASSPSTTSRRCANACRPARRCRRRPSTPGTPRPASRSSTASAPPRCCTSSSARRRRKSARARPASRCRATRRA